jgi:hypothetical protein
VRLNPDVLFKVSLGAALKLYEEAARVNIRHQQRFRDRLYELAGLRHKARHGRITEFRPTFNVTGDPLIYSLHIGLADPMVYDMHAIADDLGIPFESMAEHVICWNMPKRDTR